MDVAQSTQVREANLSEGAITKLAQARAKATCESKGWAWNEETSECIMPEIPTPIEEGITGEVVVSGGKTFLGPGEKENLAEIQKRGGIPDLSRQIQAQSQIAAGQKLAGQVGQIEPSTGITPTDLSQTEALTQGTINAIPSAIRLAGQFGVGVATVGGIAGTATGGPAGGVIGAGGGALIGGAIGFVSGIAGGLISNMGSQRTDNTNAQQRVLDEGKQTLSDWITLAKSDPSNRGKYLAQFNNQLQLIQDAHVQMITDTNADIGKFENAVPNLAEFSSFYNQGGERDALVEEMIIALQTPSSTEYEMLTLADKYGEGGTNG